MNLSSFSDPDFSNFIVKADDINQIKLALRCIRDINQNTGNSNHPLLFFVNSQNYELVEYVLQNFNISQELKDHAIMLAIKDDLISDLLLKNGANIMTEDYLERAIGCNKLRVTEHLLQSGIRCGCEYEESSSLDMLKLLIKYNVEMKDKFSVLETVIIHSNRNFQMIDFILNYVDINILDDEGCNVLFHTLDLDNVQYLVQKGINYNIKNMEGKTVLDEAIEIGHTPLIEFYLSLGIKHTSERDFEFENERNSYVGRNNNQDENENSNRRISDRKIFKKRRD